MKVHQRYFPILNKKGKLLPKFIVIRNGIDFSEIDERYASSDKDKMKESDEESSVTDAIKEEILPVSLLEESRDAFGGTRNYWGTLWIPQCVVC